MTDHPSLAPAGLSHGSDGTVESAAIDVAVRPVFRWAALAALTMALVLSVAAETLLLRVRGPLPAVPMFVVAAAIAGCAVVRYLPIAPAPAITAFAPPVGVGWSRLLWLSLALTVGADILFVRQAAPNRAWVSWCLGVIAVGLAGWFADGRPRPMLDLHREALPMWCLGGLVVVGAFIRLIWLDHVPFGFWFDEAFGALQVQRMLEDPAYRPVFVGTPGQGPTLSWLMTLPSFWLLGPGKLGMRITPAIGGTLGIIAVYLVGRELFGRAVGLAAAGIMTTFVWQVTFSRIAFSSIWSVTLDALALFLLLRAIRKGSWTAATWCGLVLGVGMWMYYTSRVMAAVLAVAAILLFLTKHRDCWRSLVSLTVASGLGFLIVVSPLLEFAVAHPDQFNGRIGQVSVFGEVRDSHSLAPIATNLERHLLMFNWEGDHNGRHNLPDRPELNVLLAGFAIVGAGIVLARARRFEYQLTMVWGAAMLTPGILSVSFEAPQTSRTMDAINPAVLIAAIPLATLIQAAVPIGASPKTARALFRYPPPVMATLGVVVAVAVSGVVDVHRYFDVQQKDPSVVSDHSGAATLLSMNMGDVPPNAMVYMDERLIEEPTIRFLVPRLKEHVPFELWRVPLRSENDSAIFLEGDAKPSVDVIRQFYPDASVRELTSPFGGPIVLYRILVTKAQAIGPMGVETTFTTETGTAKSVTNRAPTIDEQWTSPSFPFPFRAQWAGTLITDSYGDYDVALDGPTSAEATIDSQPTVKGGTQALMTLPRGAHHLEITANITSATPVRLRWKPPGALDLVVVPHNALFINPISSAGLLGNYFPNLSWTAPVAFQQIDPIVAFNFHFLPLPSPFSVEWTGQLIVPLDGTYRLGTTSIDSARVYLDGTLVVDDHVSNDYVDGSMMLARGPHAFRVFYEAHTGFNHIELFWERPGHDRQIIPQMYLIPTELSSAAQSAPAIAVPPPVTKRAESLAQYNLSTLTGAGSMPDGLAVDNQGNIYVADTGIHAVTKLDASGHVLWTRNLATGAAQLLDPCAVSVRRDGTVLVLDSEHGWIGQLTPTGDYQGKFGGPDLRLYHPRGMTVTPGGEIYIADTGGSRIVHLDVHGRMVGTFGIRGTGKGTLQQPTGVAVTSTGRVFALDPSAGKIVRFAPTGGAEREWPIGSNETVHGPQIVTTPDGALWASDGKAARITEYDVDGGMRAVYSAASGLPGVSGLAVVGDTVIVAEPEAHRIEKLKVIQP